MPLRPKPNSLVSQFALPPSPSLGDLIYEWSVIGIEGDGKNPLDAHVPASNPISGFVLLYPFTIVVESSNSKNIAKSIDFL